MAESASRRHMPPKSRIGWSVAPDAHSRSLNLRVSQVTKEQLEHLAEASGRRQSDIVREALVEYLKR